MTKLFLDTNLFLRFFLKDDEIQYKNVCNLFSAIEDGKFKPYTSSIVILELNYVARKIYNISLDETIEYIGAVKKMRGMVIIEKTDMDKAIKLYKKYKIKLGDCFIASQLPKGVILVSYDHEFEKIKEIQLNLPEFFIK